MTQEELQSIKVEKGEHSTVTIEGEIPFSYLEKHRAAAIQHIGKDANIDGFRKGHVPEKIIVEKVGEMAILNEMAERALSKVYPLIVNEHDLDVIGYPQISVTKIAKDNPLGFKATVAVVPEVTLPDYKKIAAAQNKNKPTDDVTDEEVTEQINEILRQKMAYERLQKKAAKAEEHKEAANDLGGATELPTPESMKEKEMAEKADAEADIDPKDLPLPELTDEYVKTLGQPGQFESVNDFKSKMREHLEIEKKRNNIAKHRVSITDAIVSQSEIELPQVMVDAEINQMFAQMEDDLTRAQLKIEDYLSHIKKTREDLIAEWKPAAEKRAKLQLVLNEIAEKEGTKANPGDVDHQVSHLMEQHKDADEARVRIYVESMLKNDAVMKMLEDQ